jgi:hypothetical protein
MYREEFQPSQCVASHNGLESQGTGDRMAPESDMTEEQDDGVRAILEHRDDPGEWEEEAAVIEVRPNMTEVVSFRIPSDELDRLEEAATVEGESLSEYIRKALALRMHGMPIGPAVEVSSGASRLVIRSHIVTTGRKDAPGSMVPDLPPLLVAEIS